VQKDEKGPQRKHVSISTPGRSRNVSAAEGKADPEKTREEDIDNGLIKRYRERG